MSDMRRVVLAASLVLILSLWMTAGCANNPTGEQTAREKQDRALKDPFGYGPDPKQPTDTVSGNSEFDKDALKKDLDHVINP